MVLGWAVRGRFSPRDQHGDLLLIGVISFTKTRQQVRLFEDGAGKDPERPEEIEKQAIGSHLRRRPDYHEREKVERMAKEAIGSPDDKRLRRERPVLPVSDDGRAAKRVK